MCKRTPLPYAVSYKTNVDSPVDHVALTNSRLYGVKAQDVRDEDREAGISSGRPFHRSAPTSSRISLAPIDGQLSRQQMELRLPLRLLGKEKHRAGTTEPTRQCPHEPLEHVGTSQVEVLTLTRAP
jgi:hypothetical protein